MQNILRITTFALFAALCAPATGQVFNTTRSPQGDKEWPVVKEGVMHVQAGGGVDQKNAGGQRRWLEQGDEGL